MSKLKNTSLGLMANRLGCNWDIRPQDNSNAGANPDNIMANRFGISKEDSNTSSVDLDGLSNQATLLTINGGYSQQDRMIFDKRRSLDRALKYSYQAADIKRIQCAEHDDNSFRPNIHHVEPHDISRVLINPDKTKMNYDDKIVSVHYEEDYHAGDVFEWVGTNTFWLIYLQELSEVAYFRGEIRKCDYQIEWQDEEGQNHKSYAAVRGPVETKIDYIQKHGISVDNPNHSLNIYMPRNSETLAYFKRYSKFYLQGQSEGAPQICWRVEALDWISAPGVLEITAVEYYANEFEDDLDNGIAGGLIIKPPVDPNPDVVETTIEGETFIKPKKVYEYYYRGNENSRWSVSKDCPVKLVVDQENPLHITVSWEVTYRGQFTLSYGSCEKIIVVESLF